MNAIKMLKQEHREVEALFKQLEKARAPGARGRVFEKLADALAVHTAIEERHFYPAVRERDTEGTLRASVEEHLAIKRVIADLLELEAGDEMFQAKVKVLKDEVEHHVEEEESDLFPMVEKLFDEEMLEAIGDAMEETKFELIEDGNPRDAIPSETEWAAPL